MIYRVSYRPHTKSLLGYSFWKLSLTVFRTRSRFHVRSLRSLRQGTRLYRPRFTPDQPPWHTFTTLWRWMETNSCELLARPSIDLTRYAWQRLGMLRTLVECEVVRDWGCALRRSVLLPCFTSVKKSVRHRLRFDAWITIPNGRVIDEACLFL